MIVLRIQIYDEKSTNQMLAKLSWRSPWTLSKGGMQIDKEPSYPITKCCKLYTNSGAIVFHGETKKKKKKKKVYKQ